MRPAREDIAAHDRIVDIDKILTTKILEIVPEWIEEDEWEYVNVAMEALRAGAHSTWRRCEDQVRSLVNREIAKRYNRAIDIERRGKITHAQRAWDYFSRNPQGHGYRESLAVCTRLQAPPQSRAAEQTQAGHHPDYFHGVRTLGSSNLWARTI